LLIRPACHRFETLPSGLLQRGVRSAGEKSEGGAGERDVAEQSDWERREEKVTGREVKTIPDLVIETINNCFSR
jgi:hypothetical protein